MNTPPLQARSGNTIARVESFHLAIPSTYGGPQPRDHAQWPFVELVLVKVETVDGVVGWGEAFGHKACATTKAALDTLVAPLALGANAANISGIGQSLRRALHPYGLDGSVGFALSGIDIALWDIRGQLRGTPIHELLSPSPAASSVPAYASLLRYSDADLAGVAAADAVARGHHAVKLHEATLEAVAAARAAVGDKVPLTLDVNCRWSVEEAVGMAKRLSPFGLDWIEEPCWPSSPESLHQVSEASDVPIAAGENASSLAELDRLATIGRLTYIQPSVAKLGGLSALLAARDLAGRIGVEIAPHSAYFGPGLAATLHFCAAFGLACEWYDCRLEANPIGLAPLAGRLPVPTGAGLGITVEPALLDRYQKRT